MGETILENTTPPNMKPTDMGAAHPAPEPLPPGEDGEPRFACVVCNHELEDGEQLGARCPYCRAIGFAKPPKNGPNRHQRRAARASERKGAAHA